MARTPNLQIIHTETTAKSDTAKILESLKDQLPTFSEQSELNQPTFECDLCSDLGRVFVTVEKDGQSYRAVKDCVCLLEKKRRKRLAAIPPHFQNVSLATLKPDANRHAQQPRIVSKIKTAPGENYFFGGKFGTGKTLFMWTLYRDAVMNDKRVVACTLSELLNEYRAFIQASQNGQELIYPRLSAGDLRQNHTCFSVFLDDIDKARPTEYTAEQLFELADERFGGAIVRRLVEGANVYEMF
jgi:DNA replication protein DnaC